MIKHFLAYAPAKIIPGLINFLAIYIYARIFTPSQYGAYSYHFSLVTLIAAVLFSWIRLSSFRYFNIYTDKIGKKSYIEYLFSLNLALFILFLMVFIILDTMLLNVMNDKLLFAILAGFSLIIIEQLYSLLRAELRSVDFKNYSIIQPIIKLIATIILVKMYNLGEEAIFLGILISSLIIFSLYYFKLLKKEEIKLKLINPFKFKDVNKDLLIYGAPLTLSFLFALITANSDRIAIKYFLGESSVGLYSLSYELSNFIITSLFMILNFTFIPIIIKLVDKREYEKANDKLQDYFWLLLLILGLVIIFIYIFAPYIAYYVLGLEYFNKQTISIIKLMGIGTFIGGIKAYFYDFSFQFGKRTSLQVIPIIIGALVNIIFNIILIPLYNIEGALYSTLISYIVSLILSVIIGKKAFPISIDRKSSLYLICQLIIVSVLCSIFINVEITLYSLLRNGLIFLMISIIYTLYNFKNIKKVLVNGE